MANLNKYMAIGRLTRDPEARSLSSGAKVAKFSLAVNNRKRNAQTGQYDDDPCFLECTAWNSDYKKLADLVEQYLRKGSQVFIEGKLTLEKWVSQDGQNRQQIRVIVENVQFIDRKEQNGQHQGHEQNQPVQQPIPAPPIESIDNIPF